MAGKYFYPESNKINLIFIQYHKCFGKATIFRKKFKKVLTTTTIVANIESVESDTTVLQCET